MHVFKEKHSIWQILGFLASVFCLEHSIYRMPFFKWEKHLSPYMPF